jgi:TonB family protein
MAIPPCRLELRGRCLLALHEVVYPGEAYPQQTRMAGAVTLTGTVARDGTVTGIQVVESESVPSGRTAPLMREAVENLKTWQLEPATLEDTLRIRYSYVIDPSLPTGTEDAQFALPNQITIRANP